MWLVARDVDRRGWASYNVEYRKVGFAGGGGGFPATFDDVRMAIELVLDPTHPAAGHIDTERVAVVGHSAGAHLALCAAALMKSARPALVVSIAGPTDLERLSADGSKPVDALVRNAPYGNRWQRTSPIRMLPIGTDLLCVHGEDDTTVDPTQSIRFVDAAQLLGDRADIVTVPGEGHREALRPGSMIWRHAMEAANNRFETILKDRQDLPMSER
jgi:dipeptidyl aminopeptidase/acylaminoacyl peptidase